MKLEELRAILNNYHTQFNYVLQQTKKFFNQPEIRNPLINTIKDRALLYGKLTPIQLLKWFVEEAEDYVSNTTLCNTKYKTQTFLKTVWETSQFGTLVIHNIRNNVDLPIPNQEPEVPLTREEQLKLQAERMRAAKSKKREERLKAEQLVKQKELEAKQKVNEVKPINNNQKYTKEQLEHIEWLRNLNKK